MGKEYRAKIFKSGNSVALRLPKALGFHPGDEMIVREGEDGKLALEPATVEEKRIDLTGIYGSIPGLTRMPFDEIERDWAAGD